MENIDKQYLDLHNRILNNEDGLQQNRTVVATQAVFGASIMLDLKKSFPSTTVSSTFNRGAFVETCWIYVEGGTNVDYLHKHNVHFWDQWALEEDVYETISVSDGDKLASYNLKYGTNHKLSDFTKPFELENLLDGKVDDTIRLLKYRKGDLGPVYGAMARKYPTVVFEDGRCHIVAVDQVSDLIGSLKDNPKSRRHLISLWHPGFLPDESISPQENVLKGRQALAPCHWGVTVMTRELSLSERLKTAVHPNEQYDVATHEIDAELTDSVKMALLDEKGVPRYELNLHLIMRSSDVPAGLRLNVVGYAALAHALAAECGMAIGKLWYTGTNAHIYADQIEAVKEYVDNEPSEEQVRLWVNPDKTFFDLEPEDFKVVGYVPKKRIPMPVAK